MIDPTITESGVGTVIIGVLAFMLRSLKEEQRSSRRIWERRVEDDLVRIEKVIVGFRNELDRERKQRSDLSEKLVSTMSSLNINREVMDKLNHAFAAYVASSDRRIISLENGQSEVIELGKSLRLIRTKRNG